MQAVVADVAIRPGNDFRRVEFLKRVLRDFREHDFPANAVGIIRTDRHIIVDVRLSTDLNDQRASQARNLLTGSLRRQFGRLPDVELKLEQLS